MKFTLQLEKAEKRYALSFSARKFLTCCVLGISLLLISSRSTFLPNDEAQRVNLVKQGLLQQQVMISDLQAENTQYLVSLAQTIQKLDAQLTQLKVQQQVLADSVNVEMPVLKDVGSSSTNPLSEIESIDNPLLEKLENLTQKIKRQTAELTVLENILLNTHINNEQRIAGRPIHKGWLSSYYGKRNDPFTGKPAMHKGIDFAGREGDPVIATAAGVITWAGERYGYGNLVEINHGNGLVSRYGHNHSINVQVGEVVTKGHTIALLGNTGRSTGAHVHYEIIKNGKQIDPLPFVYRQ